MSAARYHRRTNDDTAISSINRLYYPWYGSKYYSTIILSVVDTTFRKYYPTHFRAIVFSACRTVSMLIKGNFVPYYKIFSLSLISTIVLPHIRHSPTPSRPGSPFM